jgi:hypothetical protein
LALIAEKKAGFRSLGDTWADTTTAHCGLITVLAGAGAYQFALKLALSS